MNYDSNTEYYNIIKKSDRFEQATFKATRVQPILLRPQDYELAVIRFSIPSTDIPILFWQEDELGISKYKVTLEYDNVIYSRNLVYIESEVKQLYGRKTIWTYDNFLSSMNNAYKLLLDDINAAIAPSLPLDTFPPIFTFEPETLLFAYYVDPLFFSYSLDNNTEYINPSIKMYMNLDLFYLFATFRVIDDNTKIGYEHQFIPTNIFNQNITVNGNEYIKILQDTTSSNLWNNLFSIELETNTIPVNPELLPTQTNITRSVLTDFEPQSGESTREYIQYQPQGALRYYDLNSSYPLTSIDITLWWIDRNNDRFPLYVTSFDIFSIKIKFRKKSGIRQED
jgi:hypothetical protein